jgi:HAMP domain-containing protein
MTLDEALRERSLLIVDLEHLIDHADEVDARRMDAERRGGGRATEVPALRSEVRRIVAVIDEKIERVNVIDAAVDEFIEWSDSPDRRLTPHEEMMEEARKNGEWRRRMYPHMYRVTH